MFRTFIALAAIAVSFGAAVPSMAATTGQTQVIEEDYWMPWRFEPLNWMNESRVRYWDHDERSAADELRKAESWLRFAASDADPHTKTSLTSAANELNRLAIDLEEGKVAAAERMDPILARAARSLAEWHYFRAKEENTGRRDEHHAAQDIGAAARYLRFAADMSNYDYGPDVAQMYDEIDPLGNHVETEVIEPNRIDRYLTSIENELDKMDSSLQSAAG